MARRTRGQVAQVQGDGHIPFRGRRHALLRLGVGLGNGEFEEPRAAPLADDPFGGFEVGGAGEGAKGDEVVRGEGEGVGELVFVDEERGWEGEVSVEFAGWG